MSRTYKDMPLRVHGKRRQEIDARRLARAVIELAAEEKVLKKTDRKPTHRRPRRTGSGS